MYVGQRMVKAHRCCIPECHRYSLQIVYEAYGAGGTGFIMECLTDNVNRSATGEDCICTFSSYDSEALPNCPPFHAQYQTMHLIQRI